MAVDEKSTESAWYGLELPPHIWREELVLLNAV